MSLVLSPRRAGAQDLFGRDAQFRRMLGRDVNEPEPIGLYRPARRAGQMLYLSTTVARREGVPLYSGLVGRDLTLVEAQEAARITALAVLETVYAELGGSLMQIRQLINMTGYVASAEGFFEQAQVMDGASAVMIDVLGDEAGTASRSAIGVRGLSRNAAVAIAAVLELEP
ncbi:RidA family protein [Sphingopyxis sp.]|uniref:RidA family protein n=1 Tax=Sphingopyxis sp. TaxID=1908224 RepID=UPI002EDA1641